MQFVPAPDQKPPPPFLRAYNCESPASRGYLWDVYVSPTAQGVFLKDLKSPGRVRPLCPRLQGRQHPRAHPCWLTDSWPHQHWCWPTLRDFSISWCHWVPAGPPPQSLNIPLKYPVTSVQIKVQCSSGWTLFAIAIVCYLLKSALTTLFWGNAGKKSNRQTCSPGSDCWTGSLADCTTSRRFPASAKGDANPTSQEGLKNEIEGMNLGSCLEHTKYSVSNSWDANRNKPLEGFIKTLQLGQKPKPGKCSAFKDKLQQS